MVQRLWRIASLVVLAATVAAACGGDDGGGGAEADTSTAAAGAGEGAVTTLEDVESAVIRITTKGTFAQPAGSLAEYEEVTGAGSGSGFILDAEGIAVTNNHVVTGAASLEVHVGGRPEPVNARVLGVSECSDLAVIDLDGGGYPFLRWREGPANVGLEVRAAGFPLGDPQYTLTSGIVSKAKANGETRWASVDSVIEHDASIQPGNSGGPLVTTDGQVVGVNYSGGDPGTGTSQFFAISGELAGPVIDQLRNAEDVLSVGVNGVAVREEESGVAGVWVSSVATGSPAGDVGIRAGDVIERIEGLPVGTDGTMKDYCDILQSHDAADKLSVQVLRFEEEVRLRGELGGDELEPFESLAAETGVEGQLPAGAAYADYVTVNDDSGTLEMSVPAQWNQVQGTPLVLDDGTPFGPRIVAAPDLARYNTSYAVPGVDFAASLGSGRYTTSRLLDDIGPSEECRSAGRERYDDGLYIGELEVWEQCAGTGARVVTIAAEPEGKEFVALLFVQLVSQADGEALDEIIATFRVLV
jgi:serine protease Do